MLQVKVSKIKQQSERMESTPSFSDRLMAMVDISHPRYMLAGEETIRKSQEALMDPVSWF